MVSSQLVRVRKTAKPAFSAPLLDLATDERITEAANRFEGLSLFQDRLRVLRRKPISSILGGALAGTRLNE
ncbi:hypothetical protein [Paeniglutamicibacter sulfureus]|uniref:hypothetical protein n=1 Tax=Paeniglutamicibacter sulfureus TaxID=43666 RepID=UPI0035E638C7